MREITESFQAPPIPSPAAANSVRAVRRQRWLLLLIFLVMAGLQIALATRQPLWVDEIFSVAMATGHSLEHPAATAKPEQGDFVEPNEPVPASLFNRYTQHESPPASPVRVIRAVSLSDTSPPLYYLLLYLWTLLFGTNDLILRLFSIACWLGCFPLLINIARRIGGDRAVIPACLFFALSPLGLYFSGEARMYSLLLLCVMTTAWASLALQERGGDLKICAVWILASAAGFLTHYFFLFPWMAVVAFLFLQPAQFARQQLLFCMFLVGLLILPWYMFAIGSDPHWRVTQGWLHLRPREFNRVRALRVDFLQFFSGQDVAPGKFNRISSTAAVGLFALLVAAFAWRSRLRMFNGGRLLLILWFVVVCAAPTVIDLAQHTYAANISRYTLAALPAAYLLAALGLFALPRRAALILLTLILFCWLIPISNIYRLRARSGEPFRDVARELSPNASSSDLILVHSIPSGVLGVARYAEDSAPIASWVQQLGTHRVPESLLALAAGRNSIRYVKIHQLAEPAPEEDWLRANARIVHETSFPAGRTVDFRPLTSQTF